MPTSFLLVKVPAHQNWTQVSLKVNYLLLRMFTLVQLGHFKEDNAYNKIKVIEHFNKDRLQLVKRLTFMFFQKMAFQQAHDSGTISAQRAYERPSVACFAEDVFVYAEI